MKEFGPNIFQRLEQGSQVKRNFLEQTRMASVMGTVDIPLANSGPKYKPWLKTLPKSVKALYAVGTTSLSLLTAACGPSETKPSSSQSGLGVKSGSEISFEYPFSGLWYLTAGPHSDGLTDGVRAALDFAQPEVVACPGGKPLENRFVEASAAGKVAVVGNEKNLADKNHSIVEIDHGQGLRTGYMHLVNISVKVGQEVKEHDRLGNPSCEIPPGGNTSGIHLHWYAKKDDKFLSADGIKFPQGQIKASPNNKDGTLTGIDNLVRTADTRRCGPDEKSIKACEGIRNDLNKEAAAVEESEKSVSSPVVKSISPRNAVAVALDLGTCLNIRKEPSTSSAVQRCIPPGTPARALVGPRTGDGLSWWLLTGIKVNERDPGFYGWAAEDYLISQAYSHPEDIPSSLVEATRSYVAQRVAGRRYAGDCERFREPSGWWAIARGEYCSRFQVFPTGIAIADMWFFSSVISDSDVILATFQRAADGRWIIVTGGYLLQG